MEALIDIIEVEGNNFRIRVQDTSSGGEDFTVLISQADLFDKIKNAFVVPNTSTTSSPPSCETCKSLEIPPPYPDWYCARYEKRQEDCPSYEEKKLLL